MLFGKKYNHLNKICEVIEQYDAHLRKYAASRMREETGQKEQSYEGYNNIYMVMPTLFHGRNPPNKTLR